jgi:hypothetical protein
MKDLSQDECLGTNGGGIAVDIGWFFGNMVRGNFGSIFGIQMAIANYNLLYEGK